jgi:hypothetical protein
MVKEEKCLSQKWAGEISLIFPPPPLSNDPSDLQNLFPHAPPLTREKGYLYVTQVVYYRQSSKVRV